MLMLLAACEFESSPDVANAELYAEVLVTTDGATTQVDARVQKGQGLGWQPVHVAGDEALVAVLGEEEAAMEEVDLGLGNVGYTATFASASGGLEAGVRFDRTADDSIVGTVVAVPPEFEIVAPASGELLPPDTAAVVVWEPTWTAGTADVTVVGDCVPGWEIADQADGGVAEIPAEALASEGQSCSAAASVVREALGELPSAWGAGGYVRAQNGRVVSFAIGG